MSDDIQDDTHDRLVKAFIEYSRWNERFERYGYYRSSVEARQHLRAIRDLATVRRKEINVRRKEIHGDKKSKSEDTDD